MTAWGIAALKRNDPVVAQGRLARARELLGERTPSGALVLGRHARRRGRR